MQETLSIAITGSDCAKRKQLIKRLAEDEGQTISSFILRLVDQYLIKLERKKKQEAV